MIQALSSVALIAIWYIAALVMNAPVILPTPAAVLREFVVIFSTKASLLNLGATVARALSSFVIIVLSGSALGILAGSRKGFRKALNPVVTVFKATPVMSVILIAFIWFKTGVVPIFSAFLMAFPVMFVQSADAVAKMDKGLSQMCDIYGITGTRKFREYTLPSVLPSIATGAKQTLSLVWKVVIAAEVMTYPSYGMGRALSYAQVNLQTEKVFAWTLMAILVTAASDWAFSACIRKTVKGGAR